MDQHRRMAPRHDARGEVVDYTCIMLTHPEVVIEWKQQGLSNQEIQYLVQYYQQISQVHGFERADRLLQTRHLLAQDPLDPSIQFGHNRGIPSFGFELRDGSWEPTGLPQVQEDWRKGHKFSDIVYFRRSHEVIPIGASLRYIIDNMMNHYRHEHLDAFLQHEVSGSTIWNNLPEQHRKIWEHFRVSTGSYLSNFLVKRRKLRQAQLIDQYGSDVVLDFYESDIKLRDLGDVAVQKLKETKPKRGMLPKRMRGEAVDTVADQERKWLGMGGLSGVVPFATAGDPRPRPLIPAVADFSVDGLGTWLSLSGYRRYQAVTEAQLPGEAGKQLVPEVCEALVSVHDFTTPHFYSLPAQQQQKQHQPAYSDLHYTADTLKAKTPRNTEYSPWTSETMLSSFQVNTQPPLREHLPAEPAQTRPAEKQTRKRRVEEVGEGEGEGHRTRKQARVIVGVFQKRSENPYREQSTSQEATYAAGVHKSVAEADVRREQQSQAAMKPEPTRHPVLDPTRLLDNIYLPTMNSLPQWRAEQMAQRGGSKEGRPYRELREKGENEAAAARDGEDTIDHDSNKPREYDYNGLLDDELKLPRDWFNPYLQF